MLDGIPSSEYRSQILLKKDLFSGAYIDDLLNVARVGILITFAPFILTIVYVLILTNYNKPVQSKISCTLNHRKIAKVIDENWVADEKIYAPVIND